ncbi:MAG: type II toxin-antitoxin system RelE/ParE family toxin [Patescibacteria group bacterium]|mgnify:FL=1
MVKINVEYVSANIKKFITNLDINSNASVKHALYELYFMGNELTFPLSRSIGDKMFELRVTNPEHIRIIYAFYKNTAWILHVFKKKSNKIPQKEIELAKQRLKMLTS